MDARLREAALEGNIARLYALIREDPSILECNIDDKLLAETPLHVAASTGNHHFTAEVMRLKPSYARKHNPDGLCPMHLALLGKHDRMVEWFVSIDSSLVHDKGREGTSPLHHAVAVENVHLLRLFLLARPHSIEDLTTRQETALHIALKFDNQQIFEVLVEWLKRVEKEDILNWADEDGNTLLHMATSKNQTQAVKMLLSEQVIKKINVNAKNKMGLTALDIFQLIPKELDNKEIGNMLCGAKALRGISVNHDPLKEIHDHITKNTSLLEKVKKSRDRDKSQAVLTVAVLIATTTFQAVLSPPGGLWQDDNSIPQTVPRNFKAQIAGKSTMRPWEFCAFYLLNSVTFYASMSIIRLYTIGLPHKLLDISQIFLSATYCCSLILITPMTRATFTLTVENRICGQLLILLHCLNFIHIIAFIRTSWWLRLLYFLNRRIRLPYMFILIFVIMFFVIPSYVIY